MGFCYQNCYGLLSTVKKNVCTSDREKLLKFEAEGQSDFLKKYLAISPGNQIQKYIIYKCY